MGEGRRYCPLPVTNYRWHLLGSNGKEVINTWPGIRQIYLSVNAENYWRNSSRIISVHPTSDFHSISWNAQLDGVFHSSLSDQLLEWLTSFWTGCEKNVRRPKKGKPLGSRYFFCSPNTSKLSMPKIVALRWMYLLTFTLLQRQRS